MHIMGGECLKNAIFFVICVDFFWKKTHTLGMEIKRETIKKVLDSTADKWNARYRKLNRQARRNRMRRASTTWMGLGK